MAKKAAKKKTAKTKSGKTKTAKTKAGKRKRTITARKRVGKETPKREIATTRARATLPSDLAAVAAALEKYALTPEFAARAGQCLDQEVATSLVFSCTGVGAVSPDVKLGQLFPGPVQRQGFCGCVFNKARMAGSNVAPGDIPCGPTNTISSVIDSISC